MQGQRGTKGDAHQTLSKTALRSLTKALHTGRREACQTGQQGVKESREAGTRPAGRKRGRAGRAVRPAPTCGRARDGGVAAGTIAVHACTPISKPDEPR